MRGRHFPDLVYGVLFAGDLVAVLGAFGLGYWFYHAVGLAILGLGSAPQPRQIWNFLALVAAGTFLIVFHLSGLYSSDILYASRHHLARLLRAATMAGFLVFFVLFYFRASRLITTYALVLTFSFLLVERHLLARYLGKIAAQIAISPQEMRVTAGITGIPLHADFYIIDGPTGLYSKQYFQDRWSQERLLAHRDGRKLAVMEFFLADASGEEIAVPAGPLLGLLRALGEALVRRARKTDVVARSGEARLALLLSGLDGGSTGTIFEEFRTLLERQLEEPPWSEFKGKVGVVGRLLDVEPAGPAKVGVVAGARANLTPGTSLACPTVAQVKFSGLSPDLGVLSVRAGTTRTIALAREQCLDQVLVEDVRDRLAEFVKRGLDIILSAAALALLAIPMGLIACLVRLTSRGPAIFRQERIGLRGRPFILYKFRSMGQDADSSVHQAYVDSFIAGQIEDRGDPFKLTDDARVTRLGAVLRRMSLDELPQLWNVFKGDMSLVGPRPPLAYEVQRYKPWHLRRVTGVRPGITGLWQVAGRSRLPFDEMVRLDLRYLDSRSLWLDVKILIKTTVVVLQRTGAY
jgi:lipopolysaccharide/colanic/teichoic acid biosynthesis glycosyltransferase/GGDEF domain-containing protein